MRKRTPETIEKIKATQALSREKRTRRFEFGGFQIYRFDPHNLAMEKIGDKNEDHRRYYPNFEWAIKALGQELMGNAALKAGTIEAAIPAIEAVGKALVAALAASPYRATLDL